MGLPTIYEYGKEENQFVVVLIKNILKIIRNEKEFIYVTPTFIFHKNFISRNNTKIYNFSHLALCHVCTGYVIVYGKAS